MYKLLTRFGRVILVLVATLGLALSLAAPAHAAPPKPKGSAPAEPKPLIQIGTAVGPDVAELATFPLEGKRYIVVGGDITGYRDTKGVTHQGDKLYVVDIHGNFVWGAQNISGGYLHTIQPVTSSDGKSVTLYVGGTFTSVNGKTRDHVAAFQVRVQDGALDVSLDATWTPSIKGNVRNITYGDARVYTAAESVTALDPTTGKQLWSTPFQCGAIALLYANKSVYAGGFSRKAGGVTSKGAFKLSPSSGKVDTRFKPSIPANKKNCGAGKDAYSGSIPLDFAWDAINKRLIECDGGIKNYVRSLNPTTGKEYEYHRMDGDGQTCTVMGKYLFVGFHRSAGNVNKFTYNYGQMGMILGAKSLDQKVWQPNPDFSGGGANNDGRNNGIIASVYVPDDGDDDPNDGDGMLVVGGAFQDVGGGGRKKLAAFRVNG